MKISVVALSVLLLASAFPQAPAFAQAPPAGQPYIQIPVPGVPGVGPERGEKPGNYRQHCERLRDREHDIRDRLAYAPPYSAERGRLEGQLREVRDECKRCRDR